MAYSYDSDTPLSHDEWIRHSAVQLAGDLAPEGTPAAQLIAEATAIAEYVADPPKPPSHHNAVETAVRDLDELLALPHDTPIPAKRVKEIRDELVALILPF